MRSYSLLNGGFLLAELLIFLARTPQALALVVPISLLARGAI